jgi:DNA-directed RNA polymerase specialized sigma24 family protein
MPTSINKISAAQLRLELGTRFSGPLLSFFLRRIKNRAQAEDLAQEVLLRLICAADVAWIENPDSYVFTAAANLLRDHRRRVLRNPTLTSRPIWQAKSKAASLKTDLQSASCSGRRP